MVLDGRSVVEKKLITFPSDQLNDTEPQIQPNGVDLRLDRVFRIEGKAVLARDTKISSQLIRVHEVHAKEGWFTLEPTNGFNYLVDFCETAHVPAGYCAQIITRSSLVRIGCDVMSGLWDAGWHGKTGASLRLRNKVDVEWGARLCQMVFHESDFNGQYYAGDYQNKDSQTSLFS